MEKIYSNIILHIIRVPLFKFFLFAADLFLLIFYILNEQPALLNLICIKN